MKKLNRLLSPLFLTSALMLGGVFSAHAADNNTTSTEIALAFPAVIQTYFDGWNESNSAKVLATFSADGVYVDPQVPKGLTGPAIAAYVDGLKGFKVKTGAYQILSNGTHEVMWELYDPSGKMLAKGKDLMIVKSGKLARVEGIFM